MLVAEITSPHTLRRGKFAFSISATDQPLRANRLAATDPAGPPPMIKAS
jgi:hypothetical protein